MISPDIFVDSPYKNRGTPTGRAVVIHATRSGVSMNPNEFQGTLNWFRSNPLGVSAHWVIGRDGRTARCVPDSYQAHHAGQHNPYSWGIELCQGVEMDGFEAQQLLALFEICKGYVHDFNVPVVRVAPGKFQAGFTGHEDTPQGISAGKSDPGALFNWELLLTALEHAEMPIEEHYQGELNDRRWREVVHYWLSTGELRGHEVDGRVELLNREFGSFSPPVEIPLEIPDWGKAT